MKSNYLAPTEKHCAPASDADCKASGMMEYIPVTMSSISLEAGFSFLSQSLESEVVTVDPYGTVTSIDSEGNEQDYFDLTF